MFSKNGQDTRSKTQWPHTDGAQEREGTEVRGAGRRPITYIARPSYCIPVDENRLRRMQRPPSSLESVQPRSRRPAATYNLRTDDEKIYPTNWILKPGISTVEAVQRRSAPRTARETGDIVNTNDGFTIQLDAKNYGPDDIKITLSARTLVVTGDRFEDNSLVEQALRRSFTRKYTLPSDIQRSSISSQMTDTGVLIIKGSRRPWKETEISVHLAPSQTHISSMGDTV